jgi:hypothetical protein
VCSSDLRSDVSVSSDSLVSKPMKAPFVPTAALLNRFVIFTIRLKKSIYKTEKFNIYTMKTPFKVSVENTGLEHETKGNHKWR